jgi:sterol desaturase/sphingolipid hydroxylase (fatty acid hydroxylase superfamily)
MLQSIKQFTDYWITNEFLCWGVGPGLSFIIGFWIPTIILELLLFKTNLIPNKNFIKYEKNSTRSEKLKSTQTKIPFSSQFLTCLKTTLGPTAVLNSIISYLISKHLLFAENEIKNNLIFPSWQNSIFNFILLQLIGDLFLYFGHRIQHEIPFLWKFHALHHQIDTPSPISTLFIDPIDATLQGALPMIAAFALIRPHPFVFYVYILFRIAENVVNHSGLDCFWVDLVYFKFLPLRAKISHHDRHHRYSNYAGKAKNYGENFVIWDYAFGTYAK